LRSDTCFANEVVESAGRVPGVRRIEHIVSTAWTRGI